MARYAVEANQGTTFLATFHSIAKKYPTRAPAEIVDYLVASTPGHEGTWFAAAKDAGLYDEAIALAQRTPCDPRTLTRVARNFAATNPRFAVEAGLAALTDKGHRLRCIEIYRFPRCSLAASTSPSVVRNDAEKWRASNDLTSCLV